MAFLEGYGIGLGMIIFTGPVFFTLLVSALESGVKAGISVAAGIIVSDLVCVYILLLGVGSYFSIPKNQFWLAVVGGLFLLLLGVKYLFKPTPNINSHKKLEYKHLSSYFIKGFLVNFINPFVFLIWIGVITYAKSKYPQEVDLNLFLGAALLAIFTTDTLKAIFAHKIKRFIQTENLKWIYRVFGLILVGFGIRMFVWAIENKAYLEILN